MQERDRRNFSIQRHSLSALIHQEASTVKNLKNFMKFCVELQMEKELICLIAGLLTVLKRGGMKQHERMGVR